jgi:hypothetical protein
MGKTTTATEPETWTCDHCGQAIPYDDEIPAPVPVGGDLCEDCAAATKAKCMDCGREYPVAELAAEYPDWMGRTHDPSRLLCESCADARAVELQDLTAPAGAWPAEV